MSFQRSLYPKEAQQYYYKHKVCYVRGSASIGHEESRDWKTPEIKYLGVAIVSHMAFDKAKCLFALDFRFQSVVHPSWEAVGTSRTSWTQSM